MTGKSSRQIRVTMLEFIFIGYIECQSDCGTTREEIGFESR